MKQLIEEMIGTYLGEDYDDLSESILDELSEETIEAIEEAILMELSPALLDRYRDKAEKSKDKLTKQIIKGREGERKASLQGNEKKAEKEFFKTRVASAKSDKRIQGYKRAAQGQYPTDGGSKFAAKKNPKVAARIGAYSDKARADYNNLSADEFKAKYHRTKSEWERQNK